MATSYFPNLPSLKILPFLVALLLIACHQKESSPSTMQSETQNNSERPSLNLIEANRLAALPLNCIDTEFPNKPGETLAGPEDLQTPKQMHPAFYGCFDWHSSVHGHWSLIYLLKHFPELSAKEDIIEKLKANLSKANIESELAYFQKSGNASFERTYGWAWLLKLAQELHEWQDPLAQELEHNLQPLSDHIAGLYISFLPKLHYPIRVGEHTNTAFGLSFALDYAESVGDTALINVIHTTALRFYQSDVDCPMTWEPGGYDFLSPCLQEAELMQKVLDNNAFESWLNKFLPPLALPAYTLTPGIVSDRTDGKLVHLDGVNFSRAWCLYNIAGHSEKYAHLKQLADKHVLYSLPSIVDEHYEGSHWLASFAIFALQESQK